MLQLCWAILLISISFIKSHSNKYDQFAVWLRHHGASFPKMHLKEQNGIRGLYTNISMAHPQNVISIPKNLLITENMGRDTVFAKKLREANLELKQKETNNIVMFLVHQIQSNETINGINFEPYINTMPEHFDNFPIFWNAEELDIISSSNFNLEVQANKAVLENKYNSICAAIPEFKDACSLNMYKKLHTFVSSRNFNVHIDGQSIIALVPLADLINHDSTPSLSWTFNTETDHFEMTSQQSIEKYT